MNFDLRRAVARSATAAASVLFAVILALPISGAAQSGFGPGEVVLPYDEDVWPQTYSDIEPDPAIRFGTLDNGLRFALMENDTPSGQASLRMVIDAGSNLERDEQRGLAHFLEHMAFNGSRNVPEGEMIRILERLGLAFGADTNASTSNTQTVYQLDLPRTDDETVDTALMLFRETLGELLIEQEAVDRERGVVLSEERTRDSPAYRLFLAENEFLFQDHIATERSPIGIPEVLSTAPNTLIQDFYRDYYRPERTTIVAVGDFDMDVMEAKIREQFASWIPGGEAGPEARLTLPIQRGPEAMAAVEPGSQLTVAVTWVRPPDNDPDTRAERTESLIRSLGSTVFNRRLQRISRSAQPPFISAGAFVGGYFNSAEITSIEATASPGRWAEALSAVIAEQRRIAQFGVSELELSREISELRTAYEAQAARANTRQTPALAARIAGSVEPSTVVTNPEQDLAFFNAVIDSVTVEAVNAALKETFSGSGPLVFLSTPEAVEGGDAAVMEALTAALAAPVEAGEDLQAKAWPYTDFGAPGAVVSEEDVLDLDTVFARFDNGVLLTIKPTKFREDQIVISVRVGAGRLNMPPDVTPVDWALPTAFIDGGLGQLTADEIEQIMAERVVSNGFGLQDDAFVLSGFTRPQDLDIQLELLAAYLTDPGWRPEPFARIKAVAETIHDQQDATASGVLSRELAPMLRSGDRRFAFPTREEVASATFEYVRDLLEGPLASGPIEVDIVGDINVERAKEAVARTFGALANRPTAAWSEPPPPVLEFPAPNAAPVRLTHKGRADQAAALIAWETTDFFEDMHESRTLRVLQNIMSIRLIEELRENQGATYSPQASFGQSSVFPGYGFAAALIETPPENINGFFETVEEVAADLAANAVDDDELNRAKQPELEQLRQDFESNNFWLGLLTKSQTEPRRLTMIRSALADFQTITAEEVRAAAEKYLKPRQNWRLIVTAEETADE
jgi:zinc protease